MNRVSQAHRTLTHKHSGGNYQSAIINPSHTHFACEITQVTREREDKLLNQPMSELSTKKGNRKENPKTNICKNMQKVFWFKKQSD